MHGFGTMFWKNGSSLLASFVNLPSWPGKRPVERRGCSWKISKVLKSTLENGSFLGEFAGDFTWFSRHYSGPKEEQKSVENWKIFDQLLWKWPFDSWVGGHFNPQISSFVALCTWQQESIMVNLWYAWYANNYMSRGRDERRELAIVSSPEWDAWDADSAKENCPHGLKLRK